MTFMVENLDSLDVSLTKLEVTMIRRDGTREAGDDSGGVFRDCLSEFWKDFYLKYTSGEGEVKVPQVVHTMMDKRWPCAVEDQPQIGNIRD